MGTGYGSPLVANGYVYQHARQGEDEVVWCINLKTGKAKAIRFSTLEAICRELECQPGDLLAYDKT